jgi:hypothetical protein
MEREKKLIKRFIAPTAKDLKTPTIRQLKLQ